MIWRNYGLSIVLLLLTAFSLTGQVLAGHAADNEDRRTHGDPATSIGEYLGSGHSLEATFENWESEFLQMGLFVILTIHLRQRGSSESKPVDERAEVDEDPREHRDDPGAPWPVRRGGWVLRLYEHSLSFVFFAIFAGTFVGHACAGLRRVNDEHRLHGEPPEQLSDYVGAAQFWFESFQNWQSEFLSLLAIVTLTIVLRERGSAQSKPVAAPHSKTGAG